MICITGIGIVSALGIGVDANRSTLRDLRSGIAPVRFLDTVHRDLPVGEVPASDNELRSLLGLPDDWAANRTVLLGKLALREALSSAHVKDKVRTAFLNGTTVGGMDRTEQALCDILKGAKAAPDEDRFEADLRLLQKDFFDYTDFQIRIHNGSIETTAQIPDHRGSQPRRSQA